MLGRRVTMEVEVQTPGPDFDAQNLRPSGTRAVKCSNNSKGDFFFQGYLLMQKQSTSIFSGWQRRWCVINLASKWGPALQYYQENHKRSEIAIPKGVIVLKNIIKIRTISKTEFEVTTSFEVDAQSNKRNFHFRAYSLEERDNWIYHLKQPEEINGKAEDLSSIGSTATYESSSNDWVAARINGLRNGGKIKVNIQGAKRMRHMAKRFTKYGVYVVCGNLNWIQERTYKEFQHLRRSIEKGERSKLQKLPLKRWIIFDSINAMQSRLNCVQELINELVSDVTFENKNDHYHILEFLGFTGRELMTFREKNESEQLLNEHKSHISLWGYALKALLPSSASEIPVGLLFVKVMSAKDLPDLDQFGGLDPYITLKLGSEKGTRAKTTVIHNNKNPYWGERFLFEVNNSTTNLKVELFDEDIGTQDDQVGFVEIPLSSLGDQATVQTYELHPPKNSENSDQGSLSEKEEKQKESQKWLHFQLMTKKTDFKAPSVTLQLHLRCPNMGRLASEWNPEPLPEAPTIRFSSDRFYAEVMILLENIWPIVSFFQGVNSVVNWEYPLWSSWVLFWFFMCCIWPHLIVILLQSWMIYYIIIKYAQQVSQNYHVIQPTNVGVPEYKTVPATKTRTKLSEEDRHKLGWKVKNLTNFVTKVGGLEGSLYRYQSYLIFFNSIFGKIYKTFDWTNPKMTKIALISLICFTSYCLLFPVQYIIILSGGYVLLMKTTPMMFLVWLIRGVYLSVILTKRGLPDAHRNMSSNLCNKSDPKLLNDEKHSSEEEAHSEVFHSDEK